MGYFEHVMLVSHLSAHHAQCLKPLNCRCKHNKTFFPKRYFTFLCNETTSKFILKQLDYLPSFSTSDSQLGCASLTICSYKTRARSLIVNYNTRLASKSTYYIDQVRTNYGKFNLHFSGSSVWNNLDEDLKSSSLYLFRQAMMEKFLSTYV